MPQAASIAARVGELVGQPAPALEDVCTGHSGASRFRARFSDGSSAFVKVGTTPWTVAAVRREAAVYAELQGGFLPRLLAADVDPDAGPPLIVLEDLGPAGWPPPWTPERIARVRRLLCELAETPPPRCASPLVLLRDVLMRGWTDVAEDPTPFLSLGLCSQQWLDEALPTLLAAQADAELDGAALTHLDIRSDNLCFTPTRTVAVDWSSACLAHPLTDLVLWLPSLCAEGGPAPETILPDPPPGAVAVVAGWWAANAGREPPPDAPLVRSVQRRQLSAALPWASRTLGLPEPLPTRRTSYDS